MAEANQQHQFVTSNLQVAPYQVPKPKLRQLTTSITRTSITQIQPWRPGSQCKLFIYCFKPLRFQLDSSSRWLSLIYYRYHSFNQQVLYDTTPLPESIPQVKEVGSTSAPLLSASFFIGARCRPYNDDYMQCKTENPGKGEFECLKEGRRVTRCAASVYVDERS